MNDDINGSIFSSLGYIDNSAYVTTPNFLTKNSEYIKQLEARIANLEYENSLLKKSLENLKELKEILELKPQIDSLLNYYKIDLLENLN